MESLNFLLTQIEQSSFNGKHSCILALQEPIQDLIYCLEVLGPKAVLECNQLKSCIWIIEEGRHLGNEDQVQWMFHYLKDKVVRACNGLAEAKQLRKVAA